MNCKSIENALLSYTDGRATEAERAAVEAHIEACAACRARVAEFRRVWSVLDEAPVPEPSPSFDARLRARIAAEPRRGWLGMWVPAPRLVLATAALALLTVWIAMQPADVTPQPEPTGIAQNNDDPQAMRDLQVLEDYDVLADFEALSTLPAAKQGKI